MSGDSGQGHLGSDWPVQQYKQSSLIDLWREKVKGVDVPFRPSMENRFATAHWSRMMILTAEYCRGSVTLTA
ncbi:hypothetical protein J6590_034636 [Homalodisca vitripennis]|nr:hypothetical protein J6590_034636 [Homalodisca vitripennis]